MIRSKRISMAIVIIMVFAVNIILQPAVNAAAITYSGMEVSSGHSFPVDVVIGPDGKLYVTEYNGNKIVRMDRDGSNRSDFATGLNQPIGMVFDAAGNLYVAEHSGRKVSKVDTYGNKTTIKSVDVLLTGIVLDSQGKIFAVDYSNGKILKMNTDGSGYSEFAAGLGTNSLIGMAIDEDDNLYVSDRSNNKIIKIKPDKTKSDFMTGITSPTWVTLGKDGFFYVSSNNRIIVKADSTGTVLETFGTGALSPWGTTVDKCGYIYFGEISSRISRIVGSAATSNKSKISLDMNTVFSSVYADPDAFSVSGAASGPQVTAVGISGSAIELTLSKGMTSDDIIKVSYSKTGNDNITVVGSVYEIDDFSYLPVSNNILKVTTIESFSAINAAYGMGLEELGLPASDTIYLNNGTTESAAITWDSGTPAYNGNTAGTYAFSGTLGLGDNVSNPGNVKASIIVVVAEAPPNQDQAAPTGLTGVAPTSAANNNGKITGTTIQMEYKLNSGSTWTTAAAGETSGLSAGTYNVRYAARTGFNASPSANVTVPAYVAPTTGGDRDSRPSSTPQPVGPPAPNQIEVIVNNELFKAGTETRTVVNGIEEVMLAVDPDQMDKYIEKAAKTDDAGNEVIIPLPSTRDAVKVLLTGDIVKKLEDNNFKVSFKGEGIQYNLDADNFNIEKAAQSIGISLDSLKSIHVEVDIKKTTPDTALALKEKAKASGHEILFEPVEFEIKAKAANPEGKAVEVIISRFITYVERIIEIPAGADPGKITTGIVLNTDGSYSHVPTVVFEKDGKRYARINSLTNSIYSMIWNPVKVGSVKGHWAEKNINDMASRLVLVEYEGFAADKAVTRAEFVDYIVRALGLYRKDTAFKNGFTDIGTARQLTSILTANDWGLAQGYPDRTFKPNATITREEAMTMYAKAMDLVNIQENKAEKLSAYKDHAALSDWSVAYARRVVNAGVFNGGENGELNPKGILTHAEALTAIRNLLIKAELINNQ